MLSELQLLQPSQPSKQVAVKNPHFPEEETEAQGNRSLPGVTQLAWTSRFQNWSILLSPANLLLKVAVIFQKQSSVCVL